MPKSFYIETGNRISVESSESVKVHEQLTGGTYIVKIDQQTGRFFLQKSIDMEIPSKIYGASQESRVQRVINSYFDRKKSMGVLLVGDKGSGKTLLSKMISRTMAQRNIPTIVINEPFVGQEFNTLIANITQDAVVIFDEFEKVYDQDEQKEMLTLLDGTVETKKLFILTSNTRDVDSHLINRPGRIYYTFEYSGLDSAFVSEYANDVLLNKADIPSLLAIVDSFSSFTFDMLQAVVEEMNRYSEPAKEVVKYLNIDLNADYRSAKAIRILWNGLEIKNAFYPRVITSNPLIDTVSIDIYDGDVKDETPPGFMPSTMIDTEFSKVLIGPNTLDKITSGGAIRFKIPSQLNTTNQITVIVEKQPQFDVNKLFAAF